MSSPPRSVSAGSKAHSVAGAIRRMMVPRARRLDRRRAVNRTGYCKGNLEIASTVVQAGVLPDADLHDPIEFLPHRRQDTLCPPQETEVRFFRIRETGNIFPNESAHFRIENIIVVVDDFICIDHQNFFRFP